MTHDPSNAARRNAKPTLRTFVLFVSISEIAGLRLSHAAMVTSEESRAVTGADRWFVFIMFWSFFFWFFLSTLPKENPRQDFKKSEKKFLSRNITANLQEQDFRWTILWPTGGKKIEEDLCLITAHYCLQRG